ncbi:MAG: acyl-CoA dehydrogenase family protein [Deltaproteobacteria bacterium]|nr:acyl-CoA dehydrogenase family protein [Deltaproteobacteria bacterium]
MWFFSDEHKMLQETVRQFSLAQLLPKISKLDEEEGFNRDAFYEMGRLGVLGVLVAEKDGGSGLDSVAATIVCEELGAVDASTALSFLAHTILCLHQISSYCDSSQKQKYIPKLLSGQWIGGMGLTEPGSGSDALGMKTKAKQEGNYYIINGSKTFITNGPVGDIFYIYAKTGDQKNNVSTFIIEKGFEGFETGKKFSKMGMRASPTGELVFSNCKVPLANRVDEENQSVKHMMKNLDIERITISGISLGIARSAIEIATQYAKDRKQFNKPIGSFQQIQERLTEASAWYEACRALTYTAAKMWDLGLEKGKEITKEASAMAAKAKLQSGQMATQVALDAIQILGGYGYTREFPVERYMRDAKLMEIGAGTNEVLRLIIARHMLGDIANA